MCTCLHRVTPCQLPHVCSPLFAPVLFFSTQLLLEVLTVLPLLPPLMLVAFLMRAASQTLTMCVTARHIPSQARQPLSVSLLFSIRTATSLQRATGTSLYEDNHIDGRTEQAVTEMS
jgi:hypothetical protein